MIRPTLQMAIARGVGKVAGIPPNDLAGSAAHINLCQEQLLMDPLQPDEGWIGGWAKMVFNVNVATSFAYFTTPFNVARVIDLDVCRRPIFLRNEFYEFLEFGIGLQPNVCNPQVCAPNTMQAFERGSVVTLADFATTPQFLRTYVTNPADVGRRITFQGPDQNGLPIFGVDIQSQQATAGELVYLTSPFAMSVNQFSALDGILKEPTLGQVKVFMVDPTTGTQTYLTTMQPGETTAQYRRYLLNGMPCACCSNLPSGQVQVTAMCKLDYFPAASPTDYLCIPNVPALYEQSQSLRYSRMDTALAAKLSNDHHAAALRYLNGQLDLILGKVKTSIRVPIFGSDRLKKQPV